MTNRKKRKLSLIPLLLLIILSAVFFSRAGRILNPEATPSPTQAVEAATTSTTAPTAKVAATSRPTAQPVAVVSAPKGTVNAVAAYLRAHGELPDYYLTKAEARALGWSGGSVERYAPGHMIGGDRFGNNEGLLPDRNGRRWTECDIDTLGKDSRGAKRIVFSNDGLIYYTDDHYESFTQLEGAT